jgi:uncharacterized protein
MTTTNDTKNATFIHLSALSQYIVPFGNYIFPIMIWSSKKKESEFIDYNGKQVINFQLSLFLYSLVLFLIAFTIFAFTIFETISFESIIHHNEFLIENLSFRNVTGLTITGVIAVLLFFFLKIIEFILIIYASVKTSNGEKYKYPLSIPFYK